MTMKNIKKCCANCAKFKNEDTCPYQGNILYSYGKGEMEFHISCDEYEVDERRAEKGETVLDEIVPFNPSRPIIPPYYPAPCSDWAHCSNPHHDCINCPLMYGGGDLGTWTTSTETGIVTRQNGTDNAETTKRSEE